VGAEAAGKDVPCVAIRAGGEEKEDFGKQIMRKNSPLSLSTLSGSSECLRWLSSVEALTLATERAVHCLIDRSHDAKTKTHRRNHRRRHSRI
jgi:hypothetical protein